MGPNHGVGRAGEEVELTEKETVVAKLVPAGQPDFLGRAKKVWAKNLPVSRSAKWFRTRAGARRDLPGHGLLGQTVLPGTRPRPSDCQHSSCETFVALGQTHGVGSA